MLWVRGAGQWQYPQQARKCEDNLGWSGIGLLCEANDHRVPKHLSICGKKREALIDDITLSTEHSDIAVPAEPGEAAVLYECRCFSAGRRHLFEMTRRDVTNSNGAGPAGISLRYHRLPDLGVVSGPTVA